MRDPDSVIAPKIDETSFWLRDLIRLELHRLITRSATASGLQARSRRAGYARSVAHSEPAQAAVGGAAENVQAKFVAAWNVFAATCAQFLAPEPTYQAWFAHYLISQFGIDRVAREPMVKKEDFADTPWKRQVEGNHIRLDVVVMRTPGVHLPHYANRLDVAPDGTGLLRLRQMAVISELKVTATQGEGQIHAERHPFPAR